MSGSAFSDSRPKSFWNSARRAVEDRAELRAALLLDQAALLERRHRGVGVDAADARDLGTRHRLQVGDDRQALCLRLRQRRRARLRQQPPHGVVGLGVGGERQPARHLAQDDARLLGREPRAQLLDRIVEPRLGAADRLAQVGAADRLGEQNSSAVSCRAMGFMIRPAT